MLDVPDSGLDDGIDSEQDAGTEQANGPLEHLNLGGQAFGFG